jgi:hypothetical protein
MCFNSDEECTQDDRKKEAKDKDYLAGGMFLIGEPGAAHLHSPY